MLMLSLFLSCFHGGRKDMDRSCYGLLSTGKKRGPKRITFLSVRLSACQDLFSQERLISLVMCIPIYIVGTYGYHLVDLLFFCNYNTFISQAFIFGTYLY